MARDVGEPSARTAGESAGHEFDLGAKIFCPEQLHD